MTIHVIAITCLLLALVEQSSSLRERAKSQGGSASSQMDFEDPILRVPELFAMSDVIVHARVIAAKGVLILNDSIVATDYTIQPVRLIKQGVFVPHTSPTPGPAPRNLVVRRVGGTMREGPYQYSTKNSSFPEVDAPKVGDEVVWFLVYHTEDRVFNFVGGPFAAFRVAEGRVVPLTREVATRRGDEVVDLGKFLRDLDQQPAIKR